MFWTDLASCHYSKTTLSWYLENNVTVIEKNMKPPNCPELRPIEKLLAHVKRNLKTFSQKTFKTWTFRTCSTLIVCKAYEGILKRNPVFWKRVSTNKHVQFDKPRHNSSPTYHKWICIKCKISEKYIKIQRKKLVQLVQASAFNKEIIPLQQNGELPINSTLK